MRPVWVAHGGVLSGGNYGVGEDGERRKIGSRILTGSLGSVFCIWIRGRELFQEEDSRVAERSGRG